VCKSIKYQRHSMHTLHTILESLIHHLKFNRSFFLPKPHLEQNISPDLISRTILPLTHLGHFYFISIFFLSVNNSASLADTIILNFLVCCHSFSISSTSFMIFSFLILETLTRLSSFSLTS